MLLATGPIGIAAARWRRGHELVYGLCLVASLLIGLDAAAWLLRPDSAEATATLPFGLPWLEAHFRLDGLSAFFLLILNRWPPSARSSPSAMAAMRPSRRACSPYPLFLAGMVLVLIADDAFAFLVAWEFMSLTSWLLVLANHRATRRAGRPMSIWSWPAIGTAALLLAFGLLAGVAGDYRFAAIRAGHLAGLAAVLVLC